MGLPRSLFHPRIFPHSLYIKRTFFLLEILIGLVLTGLLLSLLFTSIHRVAKIEAKLDTARNTLLTRQHLHMRLQDLFMSLESKSPFYTCRFPHETSDSLIVVFKHGIDPDPAFSGDVLGRIYLDEDQNLSLAIWPLDNETLWRKEILLSHIENFHFKFLGPHATSFIWHDAWEKERHPIAIRFEITKNKTPLRFAFFLPSNDIATYKGGRA